MLLAPPDPERMTWKVDGVAREAFVYVPSKRTDDRPPVVFGFHGHGGTMRNAARKFAFQNHWPEAIVVYMQGLPTPGRLTDPEGKRSGWQHDREEQGDRDLKFFDAVLASLKKKFGINETRVYCTGHSNGGGFTYLLGGTRPGTFAALAPSAAAGVRHPRNVPPVPLLHVAGEKDTLVRFELQQRTIKVVRRLNSCEEQGEKWDTVCTRYASSKSAPVVAFIHPGTHKYPRAAPPLIVRFFQAHARRP